MSGIGVTSVCQNRSCTNVCMDGVVVCMCGAQPQSQQLCRADTESAEAKFPCNTHTHKHVTTDIILLKSLSPIYSLVTPTNREPFFHKNSGISNNAELSLATSCEDLKPWLELSLATSCEDFKWLCPF